MPSTLAHLFITYLLQLPVRKRLDLAAIMIASALPDIESIVLSIQAFQVCTSAQCVADWPSHAFLHSFLGLALVVAPLATIVSLQMRDRWHLHRWNVSWKWYYLSALVGGLLHFIPDLTIHSGADALQLLWPLGMGFTLGGWLGFRVVWEFVALAGAALFVWKESEYVAKMLKGLRWS